MNSLRIRRLTPEDQEQWGQFRYHVTVRQMGRTSFPDADHRSGVLEDCLDASAHAMGAFDGARMVGTVRSHHCSDVPDHPLYEPYGLNGVSLENRLASSVTSHLMVDQSRRSRGIALGLIGAMFDYNVKGGIAWDYIDVIEENRALFERMGYRPAGPMFERESFGLVLPMRLDTRDQEHLQKCRSPLAEGRRSRLTTAAPTI